MVEETSQTKESSAVTVDSTRSYKIWLISNSAPEKLTQLKEFESTFTRGNFSLEIYQYQPTAPRSKDSRPQPPKSRELLSNLGSMRTWVKTVLKQAENIMLLHLPVIRDQCILAAVMVPEILMQKQPVLVLCNDQQDASQLTTSIDGKMKSLPVNLRQDHDLRQNLLKRARNSSAFLKNIASLKELGFLPGSVRKKIMQHEKGVQTDPFTEAEIVNLGLLADLCSRYDPFIRALCGLFAQPDQQLNALFWQFDAITAGINPVSLNEKFLHFVHEDEQNEIKNKTLLWSYLHRHLNQAERSEIPEQREKRAEFNRTFRETVIRHRMQCDHLIYRKCHFIPTYSQQEKNYYPSLYQFSSQLQQWGNSQATSLPNDLKKKLFEVITQLAIMGRKTSIAEELTKESKSPTKEGKEKKGGLLPKEARNLLSCLALESYDVTGLLRSNSEDGNLLGQPALMEKLMAIELEFDELQKLHERFHQRLHGLQPMVRAIQQSVVRLIQIQDIKQKEELQNIYILHALPQITNAFLGVFNEGLNQIESSCLKSILTGRLGLQLQETEAQQVEKVIRFTKTDPPLQHLQNRGDLLLRAYAMLVGLNTAKRVKKFTEHKINHLVTNYKKNFFEMLFGFIVIENDLPMSRQQLALFLRRHNLLSNLADKGWNETQAHQRLDPFILEEAIYDHKIEQLPEAITNFESIYLAQLGAFKPLLDSLKASAESRTEEENPDGFIWSLFEQGIYNLSSPEAAQAFEKSIFYKLVQNFIAFVSSKYYKDFTGELTTRGCNLYLPKHLRELLVIGRHYSFLISDKVVRFNLFPSADSVENLEKLSAIFVNEFDGELQKGTDRRKEVEIIYNMIRCIRRCERIWVDYSRSLTMALLDRVLSQTTIQQMTSESLPPERLKHFQPDHLKLCLGNTVLSGQASEFNKLLKDKEVMGNFITQPKVTVSTLDEFAIAMDKIYRLRNEWDYYYLLGQDILEMVHSLSYDKGESKLVPKLESNLEELVNVLSKRLREITEVDVLVMHKCGLSLKKIREELVNVTMATSEKRFLNKLKEELYYCRSDSHYAKIHFSDDFILNTTTVKSTEKVKTPKGVITKVVSREVEVKSIEQRFPDRLREAIRIHEILSEKACMIFAPEGQKKKQMEYLLNILRDVMALCGNSIEFYIDVSTLEFSQQKQIARIIKPSNFYKASELVAEGGI